MPEVQLENDGKEPPRKKEQKFLACTTIENHATTRLTDSDDKNVHDDDDSSPRGDAKDSSSQPAVAAAVLLRSEKEKMMAGELYQAFDPELLAERNQAKLLCFELNQTSPVDIEKRNRLYRKILQIGNKNDDDNNNDNDGMNVLIESPFHCDYGYNIKLVGKNFYANHGCTILDCNTVTIGENCLLAPHVCISAATHPIDPTLRANGDELTAPIVIGKNVWIGANATIGPGVTIGDNVVVGAGAVVIRDIPSNVVVGGVPAKVLRNIDSKNEGNNGS